LRPGGEGEMAHNRPQALIRPNVRDGSFATELVKVNAGTCPLRSESDLILRRSEMTRCATSGLMHMDSK
jgi:hypothetical protein